jgi:apocytochrome f
MATNKFFKSLLFALTIAITSFGFVFKSHQHIQFCTTKLFESTCSQWKTSLCKLSFKSKAIEVEAPQAVLPNSVFEVAIKVPYDVNKQQIGANGKKLI